MVYHVNPSTGEVKPCRAQKRPCPFGSPEDHFATESHARHAFENFMEGRGGPLRWLATPKGQVLQAHPDPARLALECFNETEAFKDQFPSQGEGMWKMKSYPYALRWYSMGGFSAINAALRGEDMDCYGDRIDPERKKLAWGSIREIDKLYEKVEAKRRRVYRFVDVPGMTRAELVDKMMQDGEYYDPAYTSTSASLDFAALKVLQKPEKERVLLEIITDQPALPMQEEEAPLRGDLQSHEHEYLLARGSTFKVINAEKRASVELGTMKETFLSNTPWHQSPAERRIARIDRATLPLVRLYHVKS